MLQSSVLARLCAVLLLAQLCAAIWPCPIEEKISPCVCTADENYNLFLNCSDAKNIEELANAFKDPFPFDKFASLTIDQTDCANCHLTSLPTGVLGNGVNFREITITGTEIEVIEEQVFSASFETLITLRLTSNNIRSFPFESLGSYQALKYLHLNRNQFSDSNPIPDIVSETLRIINLSSNDLSVSPELVLNSPSIRHVRLRNAKLTEVPLFKESPVGMFTGLQNIEFVDFGANSITEIQTNTIIAVASTLKSVDFSQNKISILHPGFVTGFSNDESSSLIMSENSLTHLDQQVWESILEELPQENSVDLSDNPIICGCNIAWLVQSSLKNSLTNTTTCQDGQIVKYIQDDYFANVC